MPWPREMLTTVSFKDLGGKTEATVEWIPVDGTSELERNTFEAGRDSMRMGWNGTMEQLVAYRALLHVA